MKEFAQFLIDLTIETLALVALVFAIKSIF